MIMLLNDFMEVPSNALFCIASTIFASSFDSGALRLNESLLPSTPPILEQQDIWNTECSPIIYLYCNVKNKHETSDSLEI